MSLIHKTIKAVILLGLFVIIILYAPLSNDVNFTSLKASSSAHQYPKGSNVLNNAERMFEGFIRGPECFSIYKDELYISAHGGWVYKLNENQIVKVIKTGQDCNEHWWEEAKCGRPLGIKFDLSGHLYIVDTYYGIFMANLTTGTFDGNLKQLVSKDEQIEGKFPRLPNSIEVSKDGTIYWTDSSCVNTLNEGLMVLLADGNGRLLKLNKTTGENTVLMDNLAFANGIALSKDESFIVVSETARSRVHKYYLKGPKSGTSEIFLDNLPGYPDNLRLNKDGDITVSLMNAFEPGHNLIETLGEFPTIRKFVYKSMSLVNAIFAYLNNLYPHYIFAYMENWVGHLESLNFIVSKGVKIFITNDQGHVLRVLNADDSKVSHISDFIEYKDYYYLGSPYNSYLGRVKKEKGHYM